MVLKYSICVYVGHMCILDHTFNNKECKANVQSDPIGVFSIRRKFSTVTGARPFKT